jgi:hypothetical protein
MKCVHMFGLLCIYTYTLNTSKPEADLNNTNSVPTSHKTHCISATKTNRLMLFRETVAVYFENHTEHTDTLRWAEYRGS